MTSQNGSKWEEDEDGNLVVKVPIGGNVGKKQLKIEFKISTLKVLVSGDAVLSGQLAHPIHPEECTWYLEGNPDKGGKFLVLEIARANNSDAWDVLLIGDVAEYRERKNVRQRPQAGDLSGIGPGSVGMGVREDGSLDMAQMEKMFANMPKMGDQVSKGRVIADSAVDGWEAVMAPGVPPPDRPAKKDDEEDSPGAAAQDQAHDRE